MSAPTAINSIGADPLLAVEDEKTLTVVDLAVSDLSLEDGRTVEKVKDVDQKTIRTKALDAHAKITLKGQAGTASGVVASKAGYSVAALANFASTWLDYDPTVGTIVCMSNKQSTKHIQDVLEVDLSFEHLPYVVSGP